ncbi:S1C family serine protease [Microcella flavibacter]|uniref:S1C family serine protease n=1 Tax=Microcella flavibacter TaxID=1804990 RepID=UPI0014575F0B|nr:trypsin-like peptidase domain-containing protein [Microcella flavibacter]
MTSTPEHPDAGSEQRSPAVPPTGDAPVAADRTALAPQSAPAPSAPAEQAAPTESTAPVPPAAPSPQQETAPAPSTAQPAPSSTVPPAFAPPPAHHAAPGSEPAPAPAAGSRSLGPMIAMLAVGALIGGAAGGGIASWALADGAGSGPSATSPASITVNDPEDATIVTGVVARAMPSVVTIDVQARGGQAAGSGSGVILSEDGYVLTNSHVATLDGAATDPVLRVTASDGRIFDAELVGADPIADLAVIRLIDATDLQPIEFADSSELNVGDRAVAIGAPLGLAGTVTDGIVSALNRSITVQSSAVPEGQTPEQAPDGGEQGSPFDFWNFDFDIPGEQGESQPRASQTISLSVIQTDAAINPGNSGGALLDDQGRLIGINVAIASAGGSQGAAGSIGVGFSIPANFAQRIADEIIATGSASHGLLGASVTDVDGTSDVVGALVAEVTPAGAAEQAGLRQGDIITAFDGVPITSSIDLTAQVRVLAGGSSAEVEYVRDGRSETATVTLGELG